MPIDVAQNVAAIKGFNNQYLEIKDALRNARYFYTMVMILITLFVLFFTTWVALFLAKQISVPIAALLDAARRGAQGQPAAPRRCRAPWTNWRCWCAASTR